MVEEAASKRFEFMKFEVHVESAWDKPRMFDAGDSTEAQSHIATLLAPVEARFRKEYTSEENYEVQVSRPTLFRAEVSAYIVGGSRVDYVVIEAVQPKPLIRLAKVTADTYNVKADGEDIGEVERDYDDLGHVRWTHIHTGQLFPDKYQAACDLVSNPSRTH